MKAEEHISWDAVVVHFSEIALKRGNRKAFVHQLKRNLQAVLEPLDAKVRFYHDRLLVETVRDRIEAVLDAVVQVHGVAHASPTCILPLDIEDMKKAAVAFYNTFAQPGDTFAIRSKRSNKNFPIKSEEIQRITGQAVVDATGAGVRLTDPDVTISFRIHEERAYLEGPRREGPHGLPNGVTGRVLALFSGGIDSPPAAWLMLRRGCTIDFIHFHVAANVEELRDSKITRLIKRVVEPQGLTAKLYLVPYHTFEMGLMSAAPPRDLELILFRRFMARVAGKTARRHRQRMLVTGDNIAQVAFDDAAGLTVLRPLVAYNKQEIVTLARKIGTYEESIEPYKDCCSLLAGHPQTQPKLPVVRAAEEGLPLDDMIRDAIEETVVWTINANA
jgi:thiamine biosynthesis protein ThiI